MSEWKAITRKVRRGDYSSDDDDDNKNEPRAVKRRKPYRRLSNNFRGVGLPEVLLSKMSFQNIKVFVKSMVVEESPFTSAINSCWLSIIGCISPKHGRQKSSCNSSGYSSCEESESPCAKKRTRVINERQRNTLPRTVCQLISLIFTILTVVLCSR